MKTTGPFRYDLNKIPSDDYIVEVARRFKGLDPVERVPEELWTEICDIIWEAIIKNIPRNRKCIKANWLSEEASQIDEKRSERQSRKGKI